MTESTYYTPTSIDEFDLKTPIEINYPEYFCPKGVHYTEGFYEDNWTSQLMNSDILKQLEDWYYDKDKYGDIDLSRRVRIKKD